MRILIYSMNYYPELTGIGKYSSDMAEWLADSRHTVRVIAAPPYYPQWRVTEGYSALFYHNETINKVSVWRCPLWVPTKPSGLKRLVHLASFAFSSTFVMLIQVFWRPDVILVIEPPLFCAPTALLCSKVSGARSWIHIQDYEVDAAFSMGILSSERLKSIVLSIERWLLSRFSRVSTISDQMISKLDQKSVSKNKQVYFPNWVDTSQIYPIEGPGQNKKELGIREGNIVALYSGNMGEKQGLDIIIKAASNDSIASNITFLLCGDGAARSRLQAEAESTANIAWLSLQPIDRLNELLNIADIHLLPQRADAADLVMPSKLTGMLASGRPVLTTAHENTQIAEVVKDCGVVVPPGDVDAFVSALNDLAENAEQRLILGKNARKYAVEHLGKEAVLMAFEKELVACQSS